MKYAIAGIILILISSSLSGALNIRLTDSEKEMRFDLLKSIPVGSSAKTGKELLEQNAFSCFWANDKTSFANEKVNYIYCFFQSNAAKENWQVVILHSYKIVKDIKVKYITSGKVSTQKNSHKLLITVTSNAKTRSTVRDVGTISFNNNKKYVLTGFLDSLKRYLEEYESISLTFKVEDIPYAELDDYHKVTLSELMSDIDKKYQVKVKKSPKKIIILRDW
jgi:hypothetical protein